MRDESAELDGGRGLGYFGLAFVRQVFEVENRDAGEQDHDADRDVGGSGRDALNQNRERAEDDGRART